MLALTDCDGSEFLQLCRLEADNGIASPVYAAERRDVDAWPASPDGLLLATVENDRGYSVLRVGAITSERPIVVGPPPCVITDHAWSPDSATLAFSASAPTEPASLWL